MVISQQNHILIIDDSKDHQLLLKTLLEARGFTTECTSNGAEALSVLHSGKKLPQTILLDLNMPIMGGMDFRRHQALDPLLKDIPVVIMSGDEELTAAQNTASLNVIQKPLTISSLLAAIERTSYLN